MITGFGNLSFPMNGSLDSFLAILHQIKPLPERLPVALNAILITLYGFMILGAIVGNITVIVLILTHKTLRTATNLFLLSLAISDILVASWNMPLQLVFYTQNRWIQGSGLCKFKSYCQSTSVMASILTLMAVAVERYYAICHPLQSRRIRTVKQTVCCTIVIWLIALTVSLPEIWIQGLEWRRAPEKSLKLVLVYVCVEFYKTRSHNAVHTFVVFVLFYLLPTCIMCWAYIKLGHRLWVREPVGTTIQSQGSHDRNTRQKKRIIRMLMMLVILFIICWFPFFSIHIYLVYNPGKADEPSFRIALAFIQLLGYSNSFFNPIVYGFMNQNFRQHMQTICKRNKQAITSEQQANNTTNSSAL